MAGGAPGEGAVAAVKRVAQQTQIEQHAAPRVDGPTHTHTHAGSQHIAKGCSRAEHTREK